MAAAQTALFEWEPVAAPVEISRENAPEVAERYVVDYWDWAAKVACEMHRGKLARFDRDDLVQLARIGLWKAARRYNEGSVVRFAVFAKKWVAGEVLMGARRGNYLNATFTSIGDLKREPLYVDSREMLERMTPELQRLVDALLAGMTLEEIAAQWGCMVADVELLAERAIVGACGESSVSA